MIYEWSREVMSVSMTGRALKLGGSENEFFQVREIGILVSFGAEVVGSPRLASKCKYRISATSHLVFSCFRGVEMYVKRNLWVSSTCN